MNNSVFGARVAETMAYRGMSQTYLAKTLNITPTTLSKYISGEREPRLNVIKKMSCVLNISSDYLMGVDEEKCRYYMEG